MNPLKSRKQLLIAESELNRAQMVGDLAALNSGLRTLASRAQSFRTIVSSGAVLVAALAAWRRGKAGGADAKPSRLKTMVKGAGLVSSLWLAFRSRVHDTKNKPPNSHT